jgi:micrococcal nuclease
MFQRRPALATMTRLVVGLAAALLSLGAQNVTALADPESTARASIPSAYLEPVYPAVARRVIDGDSFEADIAIFPGQLVTTIIRIDGVDAPENRGRCASERRKAKAARMALAHWLDGPIALSEVRRDKFGGRMVARVTLADGGDARERLIGKGLARPYSGRKRQGWC